MLKRIYIDNFRCLVNFELKFDPITLLLGTNGSGKTSVFDILRRLQDFIIDQARVPEVFPARDLTRWQTSGLQRFELEIVTEDDVYLYRLLIDHDVERRRSRVFEERLDLNGKTLFACREGMAQLYRDDHSEGPQYPFDWNLSGVGSLHERPDNRKLTGFKRVLARLIVVRPTLALMERESRREQERLTQNMENFVSWYRHLAQEHMGAMVTLLRELQPAIPGFESLSLKESGEDARSLKALFSRPGGGKPLAFDFGELSDGQKMLIVLYTLAYGLKDEGVSLFIDEPDNYLALREIQPWLSGLADAVGESLEQVVLISHHPETINYLGAAHGRWLERDGLGPVRSLTEAPRPVPGLDLAKTMALGWQEAPKPIATLEASNT
ncbi:MAG: AAA family ATPase [Magnetococcales bacterium]|nr:AAA family ATPase [Magnetococcales bacterium]